MGSDCERSEVLFSAFITTEGGEKSIHISLKVDKIEQWNLLFMLKLNYIKGWWGRSRGGDTKCGVEFPFQPAYSQLLLKKGKQRRKIWGKKIKSLRNVLFYTFNKATPAFHKLFLMSWIFILLKWSFLFRSFWDE